MKSPLELADILIGIFKGETARIKYPATKDYIADIRLTSQDAVAALDPYINAPGRLVSGWLDGQDTVYAGVKHDWLVNDAMRQFERYQKALRVGDYRQQSNDCDDQAFDFIRFVRQACISESYTPFAAFIKRPGHALTALVTEQGLVFNDPTNKVAVVSEPGHVLWGQF